MVLLIFFIFLFCVALPLGEVSRVTPALNISFTLLDSTVAIGFGVWLVRQLILRKQVISFQAKSFILLAGAFSFSLLFNAATLSLPQFFTASLYDVRWILFGSIFFMVQSSPSIRKYASKILLSGGLLTLAGGYMQYFFYPSLRNLIYFGWDEHFYRMFGTFFDPNFYGLFLVLFFLFILHKLFSLSVEKEKIVFSMLFLLASFVFIAIFLTYSRTALVTLFAGIVILFWNRKFWKWLWVIGISALITAGIVFFVSTRRQDVNSLFRTTSAYARIGSAKNALTIFLERPVFGVGFNAYRYAQYRHGFMPGSPIQEDHGASGADSSLLLVLATSGIVGFTAFIVYFWSHIRILLHKKRIGLATLIALLIGSFFVNGLFYPLLLIWTWTVLGLVESS